jgi:phosphonate transport system permease protein
MTIEVFQKRRKNNLVFLILMFFLTFVTVKITDFSFIKAFTSIPRAITWSFSNFYPDAEAMGRFWKIFDTLIDTILMAIAATVLAALFSLFFAIFGSKSTRINIFFSFISRGAATISRNIPLAAWAMILLISFGQSALTGLFALFFYSFGFLTRAFMESIEEMGEESLEALRASGANYFHLIFNSVIPSCLPQIISWVLFMVETNIRSATLVGILTGTGIGFLFNLYYKSMNYSTASLIVIMIIVTVFLIEFLSNYVRRTIL